MPSGGKRENAGRPKGIGPYGETTKPMRIPISRLSEVKELLNVSHSFISEWKNQALFHGVESLRLQYQGRQGYLKTVEKEKTIEWLRAQDYLRLSDLKNYLQEQYDVVFESNQSYYNLFK